MQQYRIAKQGNKRLTVLGGRPGGGRKGIEDDTLDWLTFTATEWANMTAEQFGAFVPYPRAGRTNGTFSIVAQGYKQTAELNNSNQYKVTQGYAILTPAQGIY